MRRRYLNMRGIKTISKYKRYEDDIKILEV